MRNEELKGAIGVNSKQMTRMVSYKARLEAALAATADKLEALLRKQDDKTLELSMLEVTLERKPDSITACASVWMGWAEVGADYKERPGRRLTFTGCARMLDKRYFGGIAKIYGANKKAAPVAAIWAPYAYFAKWAMANPKIWGNDEGSLIFAVPAPWLPAGYKTPPSGCAHPSVMVARLRGAAERLAATPAGDVNWPSAKLQPGEV